MIRTDSEYRESQRRLEQNRELVRRQREALITQGRNAAEVQRVVDPLEAFQDQMADEIRWYENARAGRLPQLNSLAQIGRLLIALRIANGLSQRELAERLGVNESSVSRDERNEYHGVTIERAQRVLEALNARLEASTSIERELVLTGSAS